MKIVNGGSSIGVALPDTKEQLEKALRDLLRYGDHVVVEQKIKGRELQIAVLGDGYLPAVEIIPKGAYFDYESKYQAGGAVELCPAPITDAAWKQVGEMALKLHKGLGLIPGKVRPLAPVLAPYDLEAMDLTARLLIPFESAAHILGTDELGRDIFSRLLYSIRMSFVLAVVGTLLGAVIGTLLGFLAARFGGIVDDAVNCGIDFTASLPFIILALTIIAFLGTDVTVIIVIMAVYGWDRYARLTRNLSRSAYTEGYACALEGLGLPTVSIALRHILPNIASALVVNMTLNFPGMILLETSLSFLGVGVQPPMSSLGTMLGFGRDYLTTAWWIAVIPGLVIVVSTLSMSILGDWVQQKLEPAAR